MPERRLILRSFQCPGDALMLTAAVRDLHLAHPGRFATDVRTSDPGLWEQNPFLTPLHEGDADVETLEMHYPLIHQSNQRPYHFIHGYAQYLEERLRVKIPLTRFHGDIHFTEAEKQPLAFNSAPLPERYWVVVAGGKRDFTAKWWAPGRFQAVVDHFLGKIAFVQCGKEMDCHPRLENVIDLVGKTTTREFLRVIHRADGVLCPVTFAMHLAAAVPTPRGRGPHRACVVVAGGREPAHWEAYPNHQFLSTNGALPCCLQGGCWKSRCQLVGDGDDKDRVNVCEKPVQISPELRIPKCMDLITTVDVIRRIELYYEGGTLQYVSAAPVEEASTRAPMGPPKDLLIEFRHGLGDAVQFTSVLRHLRHYHPEWNVDVASLIGKHSAFHGVCRRSLVLDREPVNSGAYQQAFRIDWHECSAAYPDTPSTKVVRCLREVFGLAPIPELCSYQIEVRPTVREQARRYLAGTCPQGPKPDGRYPTVLIHYQANTSNEKKDLPIELIQELCDTIIAVGHVPVILDWDRRSPLPDGVRIHCPDVENELWGHTGTGDAETLAGLVELSALMVGIDSGPLHVAGATSTPTVAIWTRHHPVHFFDLAENVTHLVPINHAEFASGAAAVSYFTEHYRHRAYRSLAIELPALVESLLTGADVERLSNKRFLSQLRATSYDEHYYREHKLAGLDYLDFGGWQERYGRWFVEALELKGKRLLDVGCACGSILRGLGQAGAIVHGVEVNEHMVRLGREKWPDMAPLLRICDAVNLHLYGDKSWDAVHTAQVAEHWKPELVPFILCEFHRIVVPGGLLFCALDTEESFAREQRALDKGEDPTHICVRPMRWWHEQLAQSGWKVCSAEYERSLRDHPESLLKVYDWDWFVARRES